VNIFEMDVEMQRQQTRHEEHLAEGSADPGSGK
jgi:hypothetical protein